MTDFGKPVTPGNALREHADKLVEEILYLCKKRDEGTAVIDALQDRVGKLRADADRYDKFQPTPSEEQG